MPKIVNGYEVYERGELPNAKQREPRRGTRRKYPWWETDPAGGFQFSDEVTEQSARVQASNMSRQTGYEFKVYYSPDRLLWCMRVDGVPRGEWPDGGRPKGHRYVPIQPVPQVPAGGVVIDDGQQNDFHDTGGGVPSTFGQESTIGPQSRTRADPYEQSEFEPSGDEEWDKRAVGGVEDKEI